MEQKKIYLEVLNDLERTRTKTKAQLDARISEVHQKVPQIKYIEIEIQKIYSSLFEQVFSPNAKEFVLNAKEKINTLKQQQEKLLIENNFSKNYLKQSHECGICEDLGFIENKPCRCFKQKLIDRYFGMSNLKKDILKHENFNTFNINNYSEEVDVLFNKSPKENAERAYSICKRFVEVFGKKCVNLVIYGNTGLGKTFLCNCIAKEILEKGCTVLYTTAPKLFKELKECYFNNNIKENNMIFNADLLIIDDLGTEVSTIVSGTELFNIINSRIITQKSTVISTNFSPNELQDMYSDRIVSRIFGADYVRIQLFGEDIRLIKKKLGVEKNWAVFQKFLVAWFLMIL